jgi:hypothetical protein
MRFIHRPSVPALILLWSALSVPAFAAAERASSFVQATIVARDPVRSTVTFLDASGRERTERTAGAAAASLAGLRPGDETILAIASSADGAVVTRVLPAHRTETPAEAPSVPATAAVSAVPAPVLSPAPPAAVVVAAPLAPSATPRRSWPNPFVKK